MTDEYLKNIYSQLNDYWKLLRKYKDVKNTDEYWHNLCGEASNLYKSHGTQFSYDLCYTFLHLLSEQKGEEK